MATLTWQGSGSFSLTFVNLSELYNGYSYERSSKELTVNYNESGTSRDVLKGKGIKYDSSGVPISGVVKSYTAYFDGEKVASITGVKILAKKLAAVAATVDTNDDMKLFASIFSKDDKIKGGTSDDILHGFAGKDKIIGGLGDDFLSGGKGADHFIYKSVDDSNSLFGDVILDFSKKQKDRIDLKSIDANANAKGNQAFKFIKTAEFSNKAGELRYDQVDGGVSIQGDINGDGQADFTIHLAEVTSVSKSYFIL